MSPFTSRLSGCIGSLVVAAFVACGSDSGQPGGTGPANDGGTSQPDGTTGPSDGATGPSDGSPSDGSTGPHSDVVVPPGNDAGITGTMPPEPFYDSQHPYVQLMSPMPYATYFAPATVRMWAHAPDYGSDTVNGYSPQVDFYMGTTKVGSVAIGTSDPIDYYEVDVPNVATGAYELYVRSVMASGTVESVHVPVTVVDVGPHTGPTMDLTSDLVLSGSANFDMVGTAGARALLTSSNGSRIRSAAGWTGHFTLQYADVIGLGLDGHPGHRRHRLREQRADRHELRLRSVRSAVLHGERHGAGEHRP